MNTVQFIIFALEIVGTIAFAISGAMVGVEKRMDLLGVVILGVAVAVGGGMIRDIVLGLVPAALTNPVYTTIAIVVALLVFLFFYGNRHEFGNRWSLFYEKLMLVMDAVGLGIFTVVGISAGIREGYADSTFLLTFLGVITGVGGGLLRDMMASIPPYIFTRHIYASASILGALLYIVLYRAVGELPALIVSPLFVVGVRIISAKYKLNLPRL